MCIYGNWTGCLSCPSKFQLKRKQLYVGKCDQHVVLSESQWALTSVETWHIRYLLTSLKINYQNPEKAWKSVTSLPLLPAQEIVTSVTFLPAQRIFTSVSLFRNLGRFFAENHMLQKMCVRLESPRGTWTRSNHWMPCSRETLHVTVTVTVTLIRNCFKNRTASTPRYWSRT